MSAEMAVRVRSTMCVSMKRRRDLGQLARIASLGVALSDCLEKPMLTWSRLVVLRSGLRSVGCLTLAR